MNPLAWRTPSLSRMPLSSPDKVTVTPEALKEALKEAVTEALRENQDWLREVVREALESCAMDEAAREADARAAAANRPLVMGGARGHA